MGHATRASASLYPHQWSWDSACIAIGYSRWDQQRAQAELRGLFAGQWADGLLPHIRFAPDGPLLPGAGVLADASLAAGAPGSADVGNRPAAGARDRRVEGLLSRARTATRRRASSASSSPKLVAWHEYLYRERTREGRRARRDLAPVGVGHGQLAALGRRPRADLSAARRNPGRTSASTSSSSTRTSGRPNDHYDRYAYLVKLYRDRNYDSARIRDDCPFVVRDVLFNSLLVQANRDLAEISRVVGADPGAVRGLGRSNRGRPVRASGTRPRRRTSTSTSARGRTSGRARAPASRRSMPGVPSGDRVAQLLEELGRLRGRNRRRRPGGRERPSRRSALRSRAVLARPGLADDQLGRARGAAAGTDSSTGRRRSGQGCSSSHGAKGSGSTTTR